MYTVSAVPISLKTLTSAMVRGWQIERVEPAGNNQASKQLILMSVGPNRGVTEGA